jgi:hypothetical protein
MELNFPTEPSDEYKQLKRSIEKAESRCWRDRDPASPENFDGLMRLCSAITETPEQEFLSVCLQ